MRSYNQLLAILIMYFLLIGPRYYTIFSLVDAGNNFDRNYE